MPKTQDVAISTLTFDSFKDQLLVDYRLITLSRECSALGRKEVMTGKAKFGIFGDGKELPATSVEPFFLKKR